jgi:teichuronic acid biosynthesis protein TuaE
MESTAEARKQRNGRQGVTRAAVGLAAVVILLAAAAFARSPAAAAGLSATAALGALLLLLNPSLPRLSFWVFLSILVAAILGPNLRPPGTPGVFMAYRLLLGIFLALLLARLVLRGGRFETRLHGGPALLWLPILAWALLSLLWCRDLVTGVRYCVFLSAGVFLIFCIREYARESARLRAMLTASGGIAAVAILFGLVERATGFHLPESAMHQLPARYQWMVTSVFHNPNEFATYMALWVPPFLAVLFEGRSLRLRAASGAVCAAAAYCLLCTGSRANILALALALVTLCSLLWVRRPLYVALVVVVAGFAGLYGLYAFTTSAESHQLGALEMSTVLAEGARARGGLVWDGLALLSQTYGVGVGAGNVEGHMAQLGHHIQNVHNWWLEVLVNLGFIGAAAYLLFYAATALGLFHVYRRSPDRYLRLVALGFLAGLVGFSIGCLSSSSLIAWAPMWIYFGLCVGIIEAGKVSEESPRSARPGHIPPLP